MFLTSLSLPPPQGCAVTGRTTSRWRRAKPSTVSTASRCGGCPPSPGTSPRTPARTPIPAPAPRRPPSPPTRDSENKLGAPAPTLAALWRGLAAAGRQGAREGGGGWGWGPAAHPGPPERTRSSYPPGTPVGSVTQKPRPEAKVLRGGKRWAPASPQGRGAAVGTSGCEGGGGQDCIPGSSARLWQCKVPASRSFILSRAKGSPQQPSP